MLEEAVACCRRAWAEKMGHDAAVGETRVLPEELPAAYEKLAKLDWGE